MALLYIQLLSKCFDTHHKYLNMFHLYTTDNNYKHLFFGRDKKKCKLLINISKSPFGDLCLQIKENMKSFDLNLKSIELQFDVTCF